MVLTAEFIAPAHKEATWSFVPAVICIMPQASFTISPQSKRRDGQNFNFSQNAFPGNPFTMETVNKYQKAT